MTKKIINLFKIKDFGLRTTGEITEGYNWNLYYDKICILSGQDDTLKKANKKFNKAAKKTYLWIN